MNGEQQVEAVGGGHVDVGDQAIDRREARALEECAGRWKHDDRIVRGLEEVLERLENAGIVVDDRDDGAVVGIRHRRRRRI
jgi:hypothetical protein